MKKLIIPMACVALLCGASACHKSSGWKVSGEVYGAEKQKMALEGFNNGSWYVIDSLEITANGTFAYTAPEAAPYPEIMRLSLDGRSIYFPVDSLDCVKVTTSKADFGVKYQLSGTADAMTIRELDSIIYVAASSAPADKVVADSELKRTLLTKALAAQSVIPAYYLVNKTVGGYPLFDLASSGDVRLYGAVAQRFLTERPADPRSEMLKATYLKALSAHRPQQVTEIAVPETGLFEISRVDDKGVTQSLSDVASRGGVTVLSLTNYSLESSPAYNVILNKVWEKYRQNGLNIYQLAFDGDETSWRQTARNLPWITVWNTTTGGANLLMQYNVGSLPATFIIDRSGTLAARVSDPTQLETEVARYM